MARGTPKKNRRRTTTGAPAPKFSAGQAKFFGNFHEKISCVSGWGVLVRGRAEGVPRGTWG